MTTPQDRQPSTDDALMIRAAAARRLVTVTFPGQENHAIATLLGWSWRSQTAYIEFSSGKRRRIHSDRVTLRPEPTPDGAATMPQPTPNEGN